jgi:hypothetical protein
MSRLTALRDPRAPVVAFTGVVLLGLVLILHEGRGAGFGGDHWDFMLTRQGWSAHDFLRPHVEHLYALYLLLTKGVNAVFGFDPLPFRVVLALIHAVTAALLFVFARRRIGGWFAVGLAAIFLLNGSAAESIMVPSQIGLDMSYGAGVAALLILDRRTSRSRVAACAVLLFATLSGTGALFFLAGIVIWFVLDRSRRRDLWVPAIPLVVYAVWVVGWRLPYSDPQITKQTLLQSPQAFLDIASGGLAAVFGVKPDWGPTFVVLALIALISVYRREPRFTAILALAPISWALTAIGRTENTPRYTYISVLLLLLAIAEILGPGARARIRAPVFGLLAVFSIAANIALLFSYGKFARGQEQHAAPQVMAVDTAAPIVSPGFELNPPLWFGHFKAGSYFKLVKTLPRSTYHGAERIRALLPWQRKIADSTLIRAERLTLTPATGAATANCAALSAATSTTALRPGSTVAITAGGAPVTIRLRRFAPDFQTRPLGTVAAAGQRVLLRMPRDRAPDPWYVQFSGAATVCRAPG